MDVPFFLLFHFVLSLSLYLPFPAVAPSTPGLSLLGSRLALFTTFLIIIFRLLGAGPSPFVHRPLISLQLIHPTRLGFLNSFPHRPSTQQHQAGLGRSESSAPTFKSFLARHTRAVWHLSTNSKKHIACALIPIISLFTIARVSFHRRAEKSHQNSSVQPLGGCSFRHTSSRREPRSREARASRDGDGVSGRHGHRQRIP